MDTIITLLEAVIIIISAIAMTFMAACVFRVFLLGGGARLFVGIVFTVMTILMLFTGTAPAHDFLVSPNDAAWFSRNLLDTVGFYSVYGILPSALSLIILYKYSKLVKDSFILSTISFVNKTITGILSIYILICILFAVM